jgi:hypothetical protein
MYAAIHRVPNAASPALLDIAGCPLVVRQLEWLFAAGCARVFIEVKPDDLGASIASTVASSFHVSEPEGPGDVVVVETEDPLGARSVALLGGLTMTEPVLAIPADFLGDGELLALYQSSNSFGTVAIFEPPPPLRASLAGGTVRLVRAQLRKRNPTIGIGVGWGVRVRTPSEAAVLSSAVLRGILPLRSDEHPYPIAVTMHSGMWGSRPQPESSTG